jgi:putative transposase
LVRSRDRFDTSEVFEFVKAHQALWPIATQCRVLEVSSSGYYAWRNRPLSMKAQGDIAIGDALEVCFERSRQTYGRPRLAADLKDAGIRTSQKRLARLMRERNIHGASRRRGFKTTVRDRFARPAPDLVNRKFVADAPDQLWVADITCVPTWTGMLYVAIVLDVFSRRVVGWAMGNDMKTRLVLNALNMAIHLRNPKRVIHHSDQGTQYTSIAFGARCLEAGILPSMGSVGDCYDNAMCESFNATLECELLERTILRSQRQAALAIFDFIEGWYNPHRRHTALGMLSPVQYEQRMSQAA